MPSLTLSAWLCSLLIFTVNAQNASPAPKGARLKGPDFGQPQYYLVSRQFDIRPIYLNPLLQSVIDQPPDNSETFNITGVLTYTTPMRAPDLNDSHIAFVCCDPLCYPGEPQIHDTLYTLFTQSPSAAATILYSTTGPHCVYEHNASLPEYRNLFTVPGDKAPGVLAEHVFNSSAFISGDMSLTSSVIVGRELGEDTRTRVDNTPTTSIAMIILYAVTGVITLLFLGVIVTGAVRAHLHPERYGPRNIIGRPRQSRAKGLARAMLETLPIVKFGELDEPARQQQQQQQQQQGGAGAGAGGGGGGGQAAGKQRDADVELGVQRRQRVEDKEDPSDEDEDDEDEIDTAKAHEADGPIGPAASPEEEEEADELKNVPPAPPMAATTSTTLGCPICTDDFERGQDVRLLPCNHKFHPECIDPWLINVSGTCPLCRIDLHPHADDADHDSDDEEDSARRAGSGGGGGGGSTVIYDSSTLPPPVPDEHEADHRRSRLHRLTDTTAPRTRGRRRRSLATYLQSTINAMPLNDASMEERLDAIRRLRTSQQQQEQQGDSPATTAATGAIGAGEGEDDGSRRRSRRFSTMLHTFRVRTRRHGEE